VATLAWVAMNRWTTADLPDLTGRTVLVTGATSGLGEASVRALARTGARVLMTARDTARGRAVAPDGVEVVELDLADLSSVRKAAAEVRERTGDTLDVLMNNAGVMGTPYLRTVDGFELQIGTNHLGHAALTWLLMPALRAAGTTDRPSRVVVLASLAHRGGSLDLDDLNWERRAYRPDRAYSASKLADLLFAAELDRRLRAAGDPVISVAAHPGLTNTQLLGNSLRRRGRLAGMLAGPFNALTTQSVERGVLPQLNAGFADGVRGGDYIGPGGPAETRGFPAPARRSATAQDPGIARSLWAVTADLTSVRPDPAA
jgi:NAD(P)-dependent dehydrogenase (short-subunit alcohol dehydrogenase family)